MSPQVFYIRQADRLLLAHASVSLLFWLTAMPYALRLCQVAPVVAYVRQCQLNKSQLESAAGIQHVFMDVAIVVFSCSLLQYAAAADASDVDLRVLELARGSRLDFKP